MLPKSRNLLILAGIALLVPAATVRAQGLIIDRRAHVPFQRSFEVREVSVDARIRDQVARVNVSQTFYNPGSFQLEAEYLFPIPDDGAVQDFVLMVDGRELPGRVLPKDEARRIYEDIVRTKRDPALLEYMGTGLYRTRVFPIPPGAERKVTLRYTQVCRRDREVVEFAYPFGTQKFTAKPIQRLALTAQIDSQDAIKSLYSPGHDAEIHRDGDHRATVKVVQHDTIPTTDFRLIYTLAEGSLGTTVLSYRPSEGEDGYFLLLASPQVKAAETRHQPKSVVFVLDRSGSMSGKKIEQARNALKFVLDNLRDDDTFNIIAYDDRVETYKPELQRYSKDSRSEAVRWVENIQPGGSTNIDEALTTALGLLRDDDRPHYVLFLTDGLPTAGRTSESAIAEDARHANKEHARVFAFGVGFDVNARLLDRLSSQNSGTSEYVKPDEDIEAKVARFYARLTSPVLSDIRITMDGTDLNRTYPRDIPDLFEGGQLVWSGRYRLSGRTTVTLSGKVGGDRRETTFSADLARAGEGRHYDFVETLWAVRRVGFIIDQIDLHGKSRELTDELVELSRRHGIMTPYTSFLADENVPIHAVQEQFRRADRNLLGLRVESGEAGVGQRLAKGGYQNAENLADLARRLPAAPAESAPAAVGAGGLGGQATTRPQYGKGKAIMLGRGPAGAAAASEPALEAKAHFGEKQHKRRSGLAGGMGGMMGGTAFGMIAKDELGRDQVVTTVRQVGKKTFYRRQDRWIDADVKAEEEAKAIVLEQFSDEYFKLAREQSAEWNQYLSFEEPVTVKLAGKVYRIERPKK